MTLYDILSYCFNMNGIMYEEKQNELLYEIHTAFCEKVVPKTLRYV